MLDSICHECDGTLVCEAGLPCTECLAIPTTALTVQLACAWMGFNPWACAQGSDWFSREGNRLPLWLPAGRVLATLILARHWSLGGDPTWTFRGMWDLDGKHRRIKFHHETGGRRLFVSVPKLRTIPHDAPAGLRAGRALLLCLQAVGQEAGIEQEASVEQHADATGEAVDHPSHYGGASNPYEAIRVIEAWELGFCLGNTVKYLARAGKKGDRIEDLRKAAWYLNREIEGKQ